MKIQNLLSLTAGAVLFFNAGAAHAGAASGTYSVDAGTNVLLWDLSGSYDSEVVVGELKMTILQEPSGKFTGTGDFYVDEGAATFDLAAVVSGNSSGWSTVPNVAMRFFASDTNDDQASYHLNYMNVSMSQDMDVRSAYREMVGYSEGTAKLSLVNDSTGEIETGGKSIGIGEVSFTLPSDVTGDWNLTLNLTPTEIKNQTKYTGTAEVVTSVGHTLDFTVTGTYSAKTDVSDLMLKGTGSAADTSFALEVSTSGSTMNLKSVRGTLYGQYLYYTAPKD